MASFPARTVEYPGDLLGAHAEVSRDIAVQSCLARLTTDFGYLPGREHPSRVVPPAHAKPLGSALAVHVEQVLGLSTEKQMVWPYTQTHVAMVANLPSVRNGSVVQFPAKSVGSDVLVIDVDGAVSQLVGTLPEPTIWPALDLLPETYFGCDHSPNYRGKL